MHDKEHKYVRIYYSKQDRTNQEEFTEKKLQYIRTFIRIKIETVENRNKISINKSNWSEII